MKTPPLCVVLFAAFCVTGSASFLFADTLISIAVPNFSFETANTSAFVGPGTQVFSGWTAGYLNGQNNWTYGQEPINLSNFSGGLGTADGSSALQIDHHYGGQTYFVESASPVVTIDNNATYTLTVALGIPSNVANEINTQVSEIELLSGSTVLASLTPATVPVGTFSDFSVTFNTLQGNDASVVGQGLSIELISTSLGGSPHSNSYSDFDNVRLTEAVVPEPGTWALMLAGVCSLVLFGRRRLIV